MEKSSIFGVVMSTQDREALKRLQEREHLSGGAVIRRLVWRELERLEERIEVIRKGEQFQCA